MAIGIIISFIATFLWFILYRIFVSLYPTKTGLQTMFPFFIISIPLLPILYRLAQISNRFNCLYYDTPVLSVTSASITYLLSFFFIVEIHYHLEKSITLKILRSFDSGIPLDKTITLLNEITPTKKIIENRLQIMQENKFVIEKEGRYYLTAKGRFLAYITLISTKICASQLQSERKSVPL